MKIEIDDNSLKALAKSMEEFIKKHTANTENELFYGVVKSKYTEKTGNTEIEIAEVQLDGNDFNTPCYVGVNFASVGDRVVVKIDDGEAYIQSNFTKDIVAETLTLTGNSSINLNNVFKVDSDGNMEANSGTFGSLHIEKYTINGKLVDAVVSRSTNGFTLAIGNGMMVIEYKNGNQTEIPLAIQQTGAIAALQIVAERLIAAKEMSCEFMTCTDVTTDTLKVDGRNIYPVARVNHTIVDDYTLAAAPASDCYKWLEVDVYKPAGAKSIHSIAGFRVTNATNDGSGSSHVSVSECYISQSSSANGAAASVVVAFRNNHTSSKSKVKIILQIIWNY